MRILSNTLRFSLLLCAFFATSSLASGEKISDAYHYSVVRFNRASDWALEKGYIDKTEGSSILLVDQDFDSSEDINSDGWPDRWTKLSDQYHPRYNRVRIEGPKNERRLHFSISRAGAEVSSPYYPAERLYDYHLSLDARTSRLNFSRAWGELRFYDTKKKLLFKVKTKEIGRTTGWTKLQTVQLRPRNENVYYVRIALCVEPTNKTGDINASADFTNIVLTKNEHLDLRTNSPIDGFFILTGKREDVPKWMKARNPNERGMFVDGIAQKVEVACATPALQEDDTRKMLFRLYNPDNETIAYEIKEVDKTKDEPVFTWQPPVTSQGYYNLEANLLDGKEIVRRTTLGFAVLEEIFRPRTNEGIFGWSFDEMPANISQEGFYHAVVQSRINLLKLPMWFPTKVEPPSKSKTKKKKTTNGASAFEYEHRWYQNMTTAERMLYHQDFRLQRIGLIGSLENPPPEVVKKYETLRKLRNHALGRTDYQINAVELFSRDPKDWAPSLRKSVQDYSSQVHYWQLARDGDFSFTTKPDGMSRIKKVEEVVDDYAKGISFVIPWKWEEPIPTRPKFDDMVAGEKDDDNKAFVPDTKRLQPTNATNPKEDAASFVSSLLLSADPPLTYLEFNEYLNMNVPPDKPAPGQEFKFPKVRDFTKPPLKAPPPSLQRWISFRPLARTEYSAAERGTDLMRNMLVAKVFGADAFFCENPFDAEIGLYDPNGTPTELYLVWRTTAEAIVETEYSGSFVFPEESSNYTFLGEDDATVIVWNQNKTTEKINLGGNAYARDLWGHSIELQRLKDGRHVIPVSERPLFLFGVDKEYTQIRLSSRLRFAKLPCRPGANFPNDFSFQSPYLNTIRGKLVIKPPPSWRTIVQGDSFELTEGETGETRFTTRFPYTAVAGRKLIRFDFDFLKRSGEREVFDCYSFLDMGIPDIELVTEATLDENGSGNLYCTIRAKSSGTEPVRLRIQVFAPDRLRREQSMTVGAKSEGASTFAYTNGKELLGKKIKARIQVLEPPLWYNLEFSPSRE